MAASEEAMKLDRMLTEFGANHPEQSATLRRIIDDTPVLRESMLTAIRKGGLQKIVPMDTTDSVGVYDPEEREVHVSIKQLDTAARSTKVGQSASNALRFTLGHEIQHAIDYEDIRGQDSNLKERASLMIQGGGVRDYTELLREYIGESRTFESRAEIAGFNTVASHVRTINPGVQLRDLHEAAPGMHMYIDLYNRRGPALKGDLTIGADLQIERNDRNLESVGSLFFDRNKSYINDEFRRAIDSLAAVEAEARQPGMDGPPLAGLNTRELGISRMKLPEGLVDASKLPRPVDEDPQDRKRVRPVIDEDDSGRDLQRRRMTSQGLAADAVIDGPDRLHHPDHPLFARLKETLGPLGVNDEGVAEVLLQAKRMKMGEIGLLDLSKVDVTHRSESNQGIVWVAGAGARESDHVRFELSETREMSLIARDIRTLGVQEAQERAQVQTLSQPQSPQRPFFS